MHTMSRRDALRAFSSMGIAAALGVGSVLVDDTVAHAATKAETAVSKAKSKIGSAYQYGASGPTKFDCSGLVQWSYKQAGVSLPRTTQEQAKKGKSISYSSVKNGDLIFFYNKTHVGVYIGGGKIVHAPGKGKKVRTEYVKYMGKISVVRRVA